MTYISKEFLSDASAGGEDTLVNWSLEISVVPGPVNVALGIFDALVAAGKFISWRRTEGAKQQERRSNREGTQRAQAGGAGNPNC